MHHGVKDDNTHRVILFQFPLFGIFPCISRFRRYETWKNKFSFNSLCLGFFHASHGTHQIFGFRKRLSIPFVWDFSMHLFLPFRLQYQELNLSIPFVWDFSMHHMCGGSKKIVSKIPFQFPLFGIFPCIYTVNFYKVNFN